MSACVKDMKTKKERSMISLNVHQHLQTLLKTQSFAKIGGFS